MALSIAAIMTSLQSVSPPTAMTHIAIQEALDGKVVEWMEKVGDIDYRR